MSATQINFVRQQGFESAGAEACGLRYPALMFQPRVIGVLVATGVILQSPLLLLALAAVLYWSALVPGLNPFDAIYNAVVAGPTGGRFLTAAPAPRRFAQGLAASLMVLIGASLLAGWTVAAWLIEGLLLAALAALIFGRFCLGSYLFHVMSGNGEFARRTLPWSGTTEVEVPKTFEKQG